MAHGSGRALIAVAALAALAAPAPAAHAAAVTPLVTVTDDCGRVDSLTVNVPGRYWLKALPDGKASKTTTTTGTNTPPPGATDEEAAAVKKGLVSIDDEWTRLDDTSTSYLSVQVFTWNGSGFTYLPLTYAGAADGQRGTESLNMTNADCVQPLEPTFTDEDGSERDTVEIPEVKGVKYSLKAGVSPGKGTMKITASADKGFRLANGDGTALAPEQLSWTHTFDPTAQVTVPDEAAPAMRLGEPIAATKGAPAGRGPNVVTVTHIPGVTWLVDGKPQKTTEKTPKLDVPVGAKTTVDVEAVTADAKKFALTGTTTWTVTTGGTTTVSTLKPVVAAPSAAVSLGASTLVWARPAGFPATARFDVRYRPITITSYNVRTAGAWRPWLIATKATRGVLRAKPGDVMEVQVRAIAGRTATAWSVPAAAHFPLDVKGGGATFKAVADAGAFGRTMLTSPNRTAAWRSNTPVTNKVLLWFGTSPTGAPARVYVDGRPVAIVSTKSAKASARQLLKPIPVAWGKHVVTVVHGGTNGQTLRLDAVAYGR